MTTFFAIIIILAGVTFHIGELKGLILYIFRLEEVKEKRHERELQYRLELKRIESERRREEQEHEMKLIQMLMHARGFSPNPPVAMQQYDSTASYSQMMGCDASTGAPACEPLYSHDDSNTQHILPIFLGKSLSCTVVVELNTGRRCLLFQLLHCVL